MAHDDSNHQLQITTTDRQSTTEKKSESKMAAYRTEIDLFRAAMKKNVSAFKRDLAEALKNDLVAENLHDRTSLCGNSLIHVAAKFGHGGIVRVIARELPFLLTKRNSDGDTVLHIAVRAEEESVFNVLTEIRSERNGNNLESGTSWKDVSLVLANKKKNTALHEALVHRRRKMAEQLIDMVDEDVFFRRNIDEKSAVYLSIEAGYLECAKRMLRNATDDEAVYEKLKKGKSVIHAAVAGKHTDIFTFMLSKLPRLFDVKDNVGRSPLHLAAATGALQIVRVLLTSTHGCGANETDAKGFMPIHHAAKNNRVKVMKELLLYYHDPCELVTDEGENILHVASKFGRYKAVCYILQSLELKMLLNQKDKCGNTPLHLASKNCRPRIVSALTWDDRMNVEAMNDNSESALDVIGSSVSPSDQVFKQMLTWAALKAAKTPKFKHMSETTKDVIPLDAYKDRVNNLLLVSTLVVTVTFAAGFTMPGAYNSSEAHADPGMALNLKHVAFQLFVICNTIALYSAMLVVVALMWAQLGDLRIMKASLQLALPLLGLALTMMCLAFMTGVYVTVSKLKWLAIFILVLGFSFMAAIATLFFLLGFPADSNKRLIRFATYYLIYAMLRITGNISESHPAE